jgi:hypothetical protein
MAQGYFARITPVQLPGMPGGPTDPDYGVPGGGGHPDNSLPVLGSPEHPIVLPPLPPDAPDNSLPPLAGQLPEFPIQVPGTPEHPIVVPPGTIWPPLPPDSGVAGKTYILIYVLGVGHRWLVVDGPSIWPPVAGPK